MPIIKIPCSCGDTLTINHPTGVPASKFDDVVAAFNELHTDEWCEKVSPLEATRIRESLKYGFAKSGQYTVRKRKGDYEETERVS